ncbi:DgyrCDS3960 [Dimorphilus gyrociliatus]|uniref:GPN-loop GTPase 3 n=1 Tax=Dimorphilus gyrociliatus TaxID=2664684 RepID=A0A7I8VI37_9ANNE|nr:DgyrCDS3960 [Dimorphilus gyrociliatus]
MPRYGQLVIGPAGSGKSSYCTTIVHHCEVIKRTIHVINLDPAAEKFDYPVAADIRDLIQLEDAMEDESLQYGPNGGLIFCMEYFAKNLDWLEEQLGEHEDDYYLFDCPGQIELYSHIPVMKELVTKLANMNFRMCSVFLIDSQFMVEPLKYVSGVMAALSAMVILETTHVNLITKIDLLDKHSRREMERLLDSDLKTLVQEKSNDKFNEKYSKLSCGIADIVSRKNIVTY